jgi:serine/threonine-protein kinase
MAANSEDITVQNRGEPQEGSVIAGRYQVLQKLGSGGVGTVFLVQDRKLETPVALKLLRESLLNDPAGVALLRREVRLARLVSHPNVARIHELLDWEGQEFITMEYVNGRTLAVELYTEGPFSPEKGRLLLRQVCAGLSAAHGAGVVHRDLKPSNIQIEPDGRAVILDFGIARSALAATTLDVDRVAGTPLYMAPEQFKGGAVDARADLYSLGALAFEVFTGRPPFQADSIVALASMHAQEEPPEILLLRPDLPPRLSAVIHRCLEKEPDRRFSSAADLAACLE